MQLGLMRNWIFQFFGACCACLSGVSLGTGIAVASSLTYSMGKGKDRMSMKLEEISWIRKSMASVHKFPAIKTGHQGEFGAGS
jgi:hypothetical protein